MILINKSASADIMRAVIKLLNDNLDIPAYDHIAEDTEPPFIQVEAVSENDFSSKTRYGSNVQIDITNYAEALETKTVQEVTGSIITLLKASNLTVPGYDVIGVNLIRNECAAADLDNITYGILSIEVWAEETDPEPDPAPETEADPAPEGNNAP